MRRIENFKLSFQTTITNSGNVVKSLLPIVSWAEIKKILPIFAVFFLIAFVYHVLRVMKITLIVTSSSVGASALPFVKLLVMPSAILFTYLYIKLAKYKDRKLIICTILGIFITFFISFTLILYPHKELLHLSYLGKYLAGLLSNNLHSIIPALVNWPETLFFIMAEMWSIVVLSILFWGFCNETIKIEDAKKFYALIATSANGASICSGKFVQFISNNIASSWEQSVIFLMFSVIISCGVILLLFIKISKFYQLNSNNNKSDINKISLDKLTNKISLTESIRYLFRYKYIACLAIMVISYNIVFNLADVLWINQLSKRFTSSTELNNYLAQLDFLIGIFSLIISVFIFTNIIKKFGWKITAMIPPIVWLITSLLLYLTIYTEKFGFTLNTTIIALGTLQLSLGKAAKYCIFDQVKEMSFMPLSIEQQRNSKAAIDGLVSRFGKFSGSFILQILLFSGIGDIASNTPIIAILIISIIIVWGYATCKMGDCVQQAKLA